MKYILYVQLATYGALGVVLLTQGHVRLGLAQFLLVGVQGLLFAEVLA